MRHYIKLLTMMILFNFMSNSVFAISARDVKVAAQLRFQKNSQQTFEDARKAKALKDAEEAIELATKIRMATPNKIRKLNYFEQVRIEHDIARQEEHMKSLTRGVLHNSILRLTPDTLGFFIATGAVNFMSMWTSSGGNPALFQRQVEGLTDPIATLSFYSFIAANGFYTRSETNKINGMANISEEQKRLMYRAMSYKGLAAGSLASTFISDVGTTASSCSKYLLINKNSNPEMSQKANDACNSALSIWTTRGLANKYLPEIFSLLIIQGATEFAQEGIEKGISYSAKEFMKILTKTGKASQFMATAVELGLYATPGKFAIKSFKIVGQITQFYLFVKVDHILKNTLTRAWNNFYLPMMYKTFDQNDLDSEFKKYSLENEASSTNSNQDDNQTLKFPNAISDFSIKMNLWRDHLNSNVEADITEWTTMTSRMYNQLSISEEYYNRYLAELFNFTNISHDVKHKGLSEKAFNNITGFPYKPLPLFGMNFIPWVNSDGKKTNVTSDDAYLLFPKETEKAQSDTLKLFADTLVKSNFVNNSPMHDYQKKFLNDFLNKLQTNDPKVQGQAFNNLLQFSLIPNQNNLEFIKFRAEIFKRLGYPNAALSRGEGFNKAFEVKFKKELEAAQFDTTRPLSNGDYNSVMLVNPTSYLMRFMACGKKQAQVQDYRLEKFNFTYLAEPDFEPPSIVNNRSSEFCDHFINEEKFYTTQIKNSDNTISNNITDYLTKNINMSILGDYTDEDKKADFTKWWADNAIWPLAPTLEKWNKSYQNYVSALDQNLFKEKKLNVVNIVDTLTQNKPSDYDFNKNDSALNTKSIYDSIQFEKEFYLQTLNMIINKKVNKFEKSLGNYSVLSDIKSLALTQKAKYFTKLTQPEFTNIETVLNQLFLELRKPVTELPLELQMFSDEQLETKFDEKMKDLYFNKQINYKKYSALKKDYDNAISKLETLVGLKKEVPDPTSPGQVIYEEVNQDSAKLFLGNLAEPGTSETAQSGKSLNEQEPKIKLSKDLLSTVLAATKGLRNLEANISRYVHMKLLMRYGLKFSKEEIKEALKNSHIAACKKSPDKCK